MSEAIDISAAPTIKRAWERGFNDGIAWAASECFRNGFEAAGREMIGQLAFNELRREHQAELLIVMRSCGERDLARQLVVDAADRQAEQRQGGQG